jgi:HSP20 family protein
MINPYGALNRATSLRQMMDRLLEDAFVMPREGTAEAWGGPAMDAYEEGDDLVIEAHLPGLKPEDIDINVDRGILTISGKTESEEEKRERHYLLREKRSGRFSRSLQLPATYRTEQCHASFENGVLRLVFPKAEEAKPRRIQIETGSQRAMTDGKTQPRVGAGG